MWLAGDIEAEKEAMDMNARSVYDSQRHMQRDCVKEGEKRGLASPPPLWWWYYEEQRFLLWTKA